ncbi:MAG: nucleoside deaminase [Firmicutes bacterium]|nr:nucleoside deaminase [Bacillota bacterium]
MDKKMTRPWKEAFRQAWLSYCGGSFPIGAVIVDRKGSIISKGRNKVYESECISEEICNNKIAHAEINAILKINNLESNNDRKDYILYSTMEPCPLCFGAIVMSGIRKIKYAARDNIAGSTDLNSGNDFIKEKSIEVLGPFSKLEIILEFPHFFESR